MKNKKISRRKFLGSTAAAVSAFTIVPRHVLGGAGYTPPSEKLNVAGVGVGGMGASNIATIAGMEEDEYENFTKVREGENIVALCDVDTKQAADIFNIFPKAKKYKDFRKMTRKAKGYRCCSHCNSRPYSRRHCHDGYENGKTCILPETSHTYRL